MHTYAVRNKLPVRVSACIASVTTLQTEVHNDIDNVSGISSMDIVRHDFQWAQDNTRCGATEEILEILNVAFARELGENSFTLDGC